VPARRVPSLPLGQGFVSLRSLVPSRRPTGSSLRDIICSRFLIRRPSRWAERRLRRSTGLGDDKKDRRRTPRPLETPHRSGKRHGTERRVSLLAEVPMPQPLRLRHNRNGSSGRPSAQRVAQGASRIRDRLATRRSLVTTSPRHHPGASASLGRCAVPSLRSGPRPVATVTAGIAHHERLTASCPVASFPLGTRPRCLDDAATTHDGSPSKMGLLGETVVAPRSLNDATVRAAMRLVAVVPVSRLRDATPTGFASRRFAHSANKPPPGPSRQPKFWRPGDG